MVMRYSTEEKPKIELDKTFAREVEPIHLENLNAY